jgi:hypothetical protein
MIRLLLGFSLACAAQQWEPLFDGKTTAGWRTQSKDAFPGHAWKIDGGAIQSIAAAPRVDLSTARVFRNFELEFEWKLAAGVNSGVKYLVFGMRQNPQVGRIDPEVPKALGLEFQLLAPENAETKHAPEMGTGAMYMYVKPSAVPPHPAGVWHTARIVVKGRHVEHWINGTRVLTADLESPELYQAMAAQKRKDVPRPAHLDELKSQPQKKYPIVLTHHGGDAWFRNIRIRTL